MHSTEQPPTISANDDLGDSLYRIGTVTKLTGIAVERLRAWERRYGLTPIHRAGKTRFYSADQVAQLKQIKRLLDSGQTISALVNLTAEQLQQRINGLEVTTNGPTRVGLVGPNLVVLEQLQAAAQQPQGSFSVGARWSNFEEYLEEAEPIHEPLDLLFVQMPVLLAEEILEVQAQEPKTTVVAIYQFATPENLAEVAENSMTALKWPLAWSDLEAVADSQARKPLRAGRTAPRRFSDEQLIALAASSKDPSRCPAHLVELITQLNAFSEYALSVADGHPQAPLYEQVHTESSAARAQLEMTLEQVTEAESE